MGFRFITLFRFGTTYYVYLPLKERGRVDDLSREGGRAGERRDFGIVADARTRHD